LSFAPLNEYCIALYVYDAHWIEPTPLRVPGSSCQPGR